MTGLGFVAVLLVRVIPGGLQGAADYDEGVYTAAALTRGTARCGGAEL